jgi:hypothetical protein
VRSDTGLSPAGGQKSLLRSRWLRLGFLVGVISGTAFAGSGEEPLPTDHWAYEAIFELYAGGVWGSWPIGTRPWHRGDIAERVWMLADPQSGPGPALTAEQSWLLGKLQSEFAHESQTPTPGTELATRMGVEAFGQGRWEKYAAPLGRARLGIFAGAGTGPWWVRVRADIDSDGDLDPTFFGQKWKDHLTGTVDLGSISVRHGGWVALVGRDFLRWGSGAHDVLLVNDQSPPLDLARIGYHHRHFDFSYFVTGLDSAFAHPDDDSLYTGPEVKRYLAGHRLELRPTRSLQVGLSEIVIWGGPYRQLEAYYLNPFLPYYWEQLNGESDDNPLWSLDVSYVIPGGPMLCGEFLIDDFQIDFKSEAQQLGWLLGFSWSRPAGIRGSYVTFDWSHIEPTVYGQNRPYNRYLNHRVGMGSRMGPDADRWFLRWRQHLSRPLDVTARFVRTRQGEQTIDTPQTPPIRRDDFPSGVVERTTEAELEFLYYPDAHLRVQLSCGYRWRHNADHVPGAERNGGFVSVSTFITGWRIGSL